MFRSSLPEAERLSAEQLVADLEQRGPARPAHSRRGRHRPRPWRPRRRRRPRRADVERGVRRHSSEAAAGARRVTRAHSSRPATRRCSSSSASVIDAGRQRARHRPRRPAARRRAVAGVRDVVPTFCSVGGVLRPAAHRRRRAERALAAARGPRMTTEPAGRRAGRDCRSSTAGSRAGPRRGGRARGCTPDEVVARHARASIASSWWASCQASRTWDGGPGDCRAAARVAAPARAGRVGGDRRAADRRVSAARRRAAGRSSAAPTRPFDAARAPPSLLAPGDRVRFVPVRRVARVVRCGVGAPLHRRGDPRPRSRRQARADDDACRTAGAGAVSTKACR